LQRTIIPVSRHVKLLKSIKIFQSYDHKRTATFFMVHSVHCLKSAIRFCRNRSRWISLLVNNGNSTSAS